MTTKRLVALAALVALFVAYVVSTSSSPSVGVDGAETASTSVATSKTPQIADTAGNSDTAAGSSPTGATSDDQVQFPVFSDLPPIWLTDLPPEALDTLTLIERGGPYPFDRDDLTFQNREGLLPDRQRGHYREYTVITPGENDRGARRIVAGADGERYYTADHYRSFSEVRFD